ncbi:Pimeloyl-[acyl-carrier protein] methyl ester esterase [Streptomyces sp. YIM 130001]|uniref:alpha/beta fold hydrolase n=1 Tax=Streptomyces sp. YIM 130001 TaxID=2259644 RepID=UPI000EF0887E|nr:alpha/beta hydrolase [Streptomyces sp. YIM 130001]RII16093.1 Pimeloyl-[acyl-carrier protein] methyl ester esterase [Streptomyces sp. YIM 130001]
MIADLPVVLVPGMLCDAGLWAGVEELLPGPVHHAEITEPSVEAMADQVLATVPGPFVLVGLSLGAIVGFEVARRAPERLAGLCAMSTNAYAPRPEQLAGWGQMARATRSGGFASVVADQILPTMSATPEPAPELRRKIEEMAHRVGQETFLAQLAAQATRRDALDALATLDCPVVAVAGTHDALCPPAFHQAIAGRARHGTLRTLSGAGHLLPLECPARTGSVVTRWLEEHVAATVIR